MRKKILLFLLLCLVMLLMSGCGGPTEPDKPGTVWIEGIYERVYPITTTDNRVQDVSIYSREMGGINVNVTQISADKFSFSTARLKANYPDGAPYEFSVDDMLVWTEQRTAVGKKITINGKILEAIFNTGTEEVARCRIDEKGVVYDAY